MNTTKKVVKIQLDFMQGPIWISDVETGEPLTGINAIDSDPTIKELNKKAGQLFSSYYEFNSHDQACWFNHEKEKEDKEIMLDIIQKMLARLNEINDGTFIVKDYVSERLKKL